MKNYLGCPDLVCPKETIGAYQWYNQSITKNFDAIDPIFTKTDNCESVRNLDNVPF